MTLDRPAIDLGRAFPRQSARDDYRILHEQGESALIAQYGDRIASDLVNTWADCRVLKIIHSSAGYTIKTFKKYAA